MITITDNELEYTGSDKILGFEAVAVFMTIYERVGAIEQCTMIKMLLELLEETQT